jgi:hypothetical protein
MAMAKPMIAILGWGSLIWDTKHKDAPCFDKWHEPWLEDGPSIKLEFSRISEKSRPGALTLVIDPVHGSICQVLYCLSKRTVPTDAFEDLRKRENIPRGRDGNLLRSIGRLLRDKGQSVCRDNESCQSILAWAERKNIAVVTWTDLSGNFTKIKNKQFSIPEALAHLETLGPDARALALEYVRRAPPCVWTGFRRALEADPRFR